MSDDASLTAALIADDTAEDAGMHPDDRVTCYRCQSWADHAHSLFTGQRTAVDA